MDSSELTREADRALTTGDVRRAIALLEEAAQGGHADTSLWLKLATLHRMTNKPRLALDAVHRALQFQPLDFTSLLLRASLLQHLNYRSAGEAWGHALAQQPAGALPEQLSSVVAEGKVHHEAWLAEREARLRHGMAIAEANASDEERARIQRFRSNVLRRTEPCHSQPTHFHFPGLRECEFHSRRLFPWLERLEAATGAITEEWNTVMHSEHAELAPYIQYEDHMPLEQWRELNRNPDWTAIHLIRNGERVEANARHCPETLELLAQIGQPHIQGAGPNAMFSLLAPGTAIPPHVGVNNTRLVCHLPLVVPDGCWFRVGAETRHWKAGEAFVFDDTIEHEAMNPSDRLRTVLIFDIWNPELGPFERRAVEALIAIESRGADL